MIVKIRTWNFVVLGFPDEVEVLEWAKIMKNKAKKKPKKLLLRINKYTNKW